ncbi:MAG: helix-turn-helix domain-containing protein [Rhizobiales bacterium]|nr:helix-turn-helix domain-containing protein [Hyphomicrobiales bacterium]
MARRDAHAGRHILARNLRRLRLAKGITQEALADAADVRQALISELESSKIDVRLDTLQRVSHALGARLADLLDDKRG